MGGSSFEIVKGVKGVKGEEGKTSVFGKKKKKASENR